MCTVVGYVGKNYCRSFVMDALTRLEYRGYDSAGFVCLHPQDNRLMYTKSQGGVKNLLNHFEKSPIDGYLGMGHTRWSTHGVVSTENAHPQFDCHKKISIVHNGIIENYHELKKEISAQGHVLRSQTDTEVVAHVLESLLPKYKTLKEAIGALVQKLDGAYACALLLEDYPDTMVVIRKRSPLCIGCGDDEMFVASDALGFAGRSNKVLYLPDCSYAFIKKNSIELYDFSGSVLPLNFQIVDIQWTADAKHGYDHFMLKEIYEQKKVIQDTVHKYRQLGDKVWAQMGMTSQHIKDLSSIEMLGCGTSWHAGLIGSFFFEQIAKIPTRVLLASELRNIPYFPQRNSFSLSISQSGETADTLEALRFLQSHNIHTVTLTNVSSSTMVRETGGYLLTYAGPEIAVASTKAFAAQLAALYWVANRIALEKGHITKREFELAEEHLLIVAEVLENTIENYKLEITQKLAPKYAQYNTSFFIGRHLSYPFAKEAALKLKEIAYVFTDSCPAGELKHGSLALIDPYTPTYLFSSLDPIVYQKLVSNAQEIKARGGHLVSFAFEGQKELIEISDYAFVVPVVKPLLAPLAMTGLMQFFVYSIARELDRPIDKPRNLAKSVTVE